MWIQDLLHNHVNFESRRAHWDLCLPLDHSEMLVTAMPWFQIQRGSQKISRGSEDEHGFEI